MFRVPPRSMSDDAELPHSRTCTFTAVRGLPPQPEIGIPGFHESNPSLFMVSNSQRHKDNLAVCLVSDLVIPSNPRLSYW